MRRRWQCNAARKAFLHGVTVTILESDHLIGALYETAAGEEGWSNTLSRICRAFKACAAGLLIHDFSAGRGAVRYGSNISPGFREAYTRKFSAKNPWLRPVANGQEQTVNTGEELFPGSQLVETDFYREYLQPQNLYHGLCGVITRRQDEVSFINLFRSPKMAPFDDGDKAALYRLLPHLGRALKLHDELQRDRQESNNFRELLALLPIPYLLVDHCRRLQFQNLAAERILERADGLISRNGYLVASSRKNNQELNDAITAITDGHAELRNGGENLLISRGQNCLPLICLLFPVGGRLGADENQSGRLVTILIKDPHGKRLDPLKGFVSTFQLTRAEARLVAILKDGHGLFEAADLLGVTKNTARTHMRHIYSKVGMNRQTDLVSLLEKFSAF